MLSNLFSTNSLQQKLTESPTFRQPLTQTKLLQAPLELPFMVSQSNDFSVGNLISTDGNLIPAGLSFLLGNQSKSNPVSGKSDLDIADILVNKMPIPSLNKALEPSLLQLSTLYLQHLAINQQQSILENSASVVANDLTNLLKPSTNTKVTKDGETSDQSESLQQLLARNKEISELIDALTNKRKTSKEDENKTETYSSNTHVSTTGYTIHPQHLLETPLSSISVLPTGVPISKNAIPVSILTVPSVLRQDSSTVEGSYRNPKINTWNKLVSDEESVRKDVPVLLETSASADNLLHIIKPDANKSVVVIEPSSDFTRDKSNDNNIVLNPISTLPTKTALYALQNLIIESRKDDNEVEIDIENPTDESESSRKRRYSSVTMVPISQYDPLDPNNEPLPTRITQESKVLYKCDVCNVTFSVLATLQAHAKQHIVDKLEQCNYCQASFSDHEEYYKHVATHRGEENIFSCPYCPKLFTSKGDYNKHITKHTQRRPYLCSHCQKAFRDPGSLTKHERIHTGEQPYVCPTCHRGFAEKSSLRKHMRVHSGEKPYKCEECDKSFSISGNLQRHLFIHTGQRPFKCGQCAKTFNNPSHLRRHIKNLHNVQAKTEPSALNNNKIFVAPRMNVIELRHDE